MFSDFDYHKYKFNSLLIIIYGLNRCVQGMQSKVLIEYGLQEDIELFWKYFYWFLYYYLVLVIIEFIIFYINIKKVSLNSLKLKIKLFETNNTNDCELYSFNANIDNNIQEFSQNFNNNENTCNKYINQVMIAWIAPSYNVQKQGNNNIHILDNISGNCHANTINAIMGPSGAGKTTLLKCLNGRLMSGLSEESKIYKSFNTKIKTCFIVQNICEHLLNGLTVRQTLLYASKLKNSRIGIQLDHKKICEDLMNELLISDVSDNRVETCSGGERKRIAIACELTAHIKPNLLCIDEPTSGLDSNSAEVVRV